MKKVFRNVVAVFAAAMLVSAFASCSDSDDDDEKKTEESAGNADTAVEVFSGTQTIDWGDDGLVIDHEKFTADFNALCITYNATEGAFKMAVCDPWTDINPTSLSEGDIADDGAINLPTGDAKSITVTLDDDSIAGIKGKGVDGAWGGLKIYGADTITITKVELVTAE